MTKITIETESDIDTITVNISYANGTSKVKTIGGDNSKPYEPPERNFPKAKSPSNSSIEEAAPVELDIPDIEPKGGEGMEMDEL